jgi:hypothetical protein
MTDKRDRSDRRRREVLIPATFDLPPPSNRKAAQGHSPDSFVSAKTAIPIPSKHPALSEALIQLSLDPRVRSIDYVPTAIVASEQIDLGAIVVQRVDGRFLLDLVQARPIRDLDGEGLSLIALGKLGLKSWVISAKSLRREPRYSNALFVWLYNGHPVAREQRKRILRALTDKEPIPLGQLERRSGRDPFPSIMALVCADLVELDLISQPITRTTIVRCRARAD